jgi:hypothetical protein
VTESLSPRPNPSPEIRFQTVQPPNSMLSIPSAANTVAPEQQAPVSGQPEQKRGARRKLWFFATIASLIGVVSAGALKGQASISADVHHGSPGYRMSKSGKHQHWKDKALKIYIDESVVKIGASDAVMQAFGKWVESDARLPDISFDSGKTSAKPMMDGKSTVSYARITTPGHERDLAITMTYSDDSSGEIVEADIVLNSLYPLGVLQANEKSWHRRGDHDGDGDHDRTSGSSTSMADEAENCENRYDVQNVTTHEVGHFFGLGEDPTELGSTMFQKIDQCETHKRALAPSDVAALTTLYAESEDPEEAAAGPRCAFVGAAGAGSAGYGWAAGLILGLLVARRRRSG